MNSESTTIPLSSSKSKSNSSSSLSTEETHHENTSKSSNSSSRRNSSSSNGGDQKRSKEKNSRASKERTKSRSSSVGVDGGANRQRQLGKSSTLLDYCSENFKLMASFYLSGLKDSLAFFPLTAWIIYGSSTLGSRSLTSTFVTLAVFLSVSFLLHDIILASIYSWVSSFFYSSSSSHPSSLNTSSSDLSTNQSANAKLTGSGTTSSSWWPFIHFVFWILPCYLVVYELNQTRYNEMGTRSFQILVGEPAPKGGGVVGNAVSRTVKKLYKRIFLGIYISLIIFFTLLPHPIHFLSLPLEIFHLLFLGPFLVFAYKAENRGWDLDQTITYFETHWVYMAGFGTPALLLALLWPTSVRYGLLAIIFPLYIVIANKAHPRPLQQDSIHFRPRLHIFSFTNFLSSQLVKQLVSKEQHHH